MSLGAFVCFSLRARTQRGRAFSVTQVAGEAGHFHARNVRGEARNAPEKGLVKLIFANDNARGFCAFA